MLDVVKGLVLRTVEVKEADLMMSVYTHERGVISVYAKGVKNPKSKRGAACQELAYSEFTLFESGDKLWAREATLIRLFMSPTNSVTFLSLSSYVREVLADVATSETDEDLMRLVLNTLHALSLERYDPDLLKAAFEMRALSIIGFMPSVTACEGCGRQDGEFYFDIMSGVVECRDCRREREATATPDDGERSLTVILSQGARVALEYCVHAPMERLFSFALSGEDMALFSRAAEAYLTNQLERSFNSLEYYHMMKGL